MICDVFFRIKLFNTPGILYAYWYSICIGWWKLALYSLNFKHKCNIMNTSISSVLISCHKNGCYFYSFSEWLVLIVNVEKLISTIKYICGTYECLQLATIQIICSSYTCCNARRHALGNHIETLVYFLTNIISFHYLEKLHRRRIWISLPTETIWWPLFIWITRKVNLIKIWKISKGKLIMWRNRRHYRRWFIRLHLCG